MKRADSNTLQKCVTPAISARNCVHTHAKTHRMFYKRGDEEEEGRGDGGWIMWRGNKKFENEPEKGVERIFSHNSVGDVMV